jgi:hypothetical protein
MSQQNWCKQTGKRMLLVEGKTPESKIYLGRLEIRSPRFILDVSKSGVQDLSWTSLSSESKIYLGRLSVRSPRFILDVFPSGVQDLSWTSIYSLLFFF